MVFSVRSVPRCYKQDSWSNELVVRQSPSGKNVSTETYEIVGIRYQATIGADTADWEDLVRAVVNCKSVWISDYAIVTICKCSINPITESKPRP
jgi:hypothetical protein